MKKWIILLGQLYLRFTDPNRRIEKLQRRLDSVKQKRERVLFKRNSAANSTKFYNYAMLIIRLRKQIEQLKESRR